MPWLVVLGQGSWSPKPGVRFRAGKHKISREVADSARAARAKGQKSLIVLDDEPEIVTSLGTGMLTAEDVRVGNSAGVRIPLPEAEAELEQEYEIPLEHPCHWCTKKYPSAAALKRHVDFHHPDFA